MFKVLAHYGTPFFGVQTEGLGICILQFYMLCNVMGVYSIHILYIYIYSYIDIICTFSF